jgi:hypothetical protein
MVKVLKNMMCSSLNLALLTKMSENEVALFVKLWGLLALAKQN